MARPATAGAGVRGCWRIGEYRVASGRDGHPRLSAFPRTTNPIQDQHTRENRAVPRAALDCDGRGRLSFAKQFRRLWPP
jgi:hypothetical protein